MLDTPRAPRRRVRQPSGAVRSATFGAPKAPASPAWSDALGIAVSERPRKSTSTTALLAAAHRGLQADRHRVVPTVDHRRARMRHRPGALNGTSTSTAAATRPNANSNGADDRATTVGNPRLRPTVPFDRRQRQRPVTAHVAGLEQGTLYHYRVVARNANGSSSEASTGRSAPQGPPALVEGSRPRSQHRRRRRQRRHRPERRRHRHTASNTGTRLRGIDLRTASRRRTAARSPTRRPDRHRQVLDGPRRRTPSTTTGSWPTNDAATSRRHRPDLQDLPAEPADDQCANALVRQQTGAALLLDCRAYELVSAANAGGYDVESDLVPGQTPLAGVPDAHGPTSLYSLHYGNDPGHRRQPDQPRPRPLRRDRGPRTAGRPGTSACRPTELLAEQPFGSPLAGADSASRPSPSAAPTSALRASPTARPASRCGSRTAASSRAWRARSNPARAPTRRVRRPSALGRRHATSSSARPRSSSPTGNSNGDVTIYDRNLADRRDPRRLRRYPAATAR